MPVNNTNSLDQLQWDLCVEDADSFLSDEDHLYDEDYLYDDEKVIGEYGYRVVEPEEINDSPPDIVDEEDHPEEYNSYLIGLDLEPEDAARYDRLSSEAGVRVDDPYEKLPLRAAVTCAIDALPKYRKLLVAVMAQLADREQKTVNVNQLANELKMPYSTVYERWASAMLKLRKELQYDPAIQEWSESTRPVSEE